MVASSIVNYVGQHQDSKSFRSKELPKVVANLA